MKFFKFLFQGSKKETIRDIAIKALYDRVNNYANWSCEKGIYLPPDFETDPAGWANALRDMQRAFKLLNDEALGKGPLWKAKNEWKQFGEKNMPEIEDLNKEIEKGLTLFGKYLFYLTDDTLNSF